MSKRSTPTKQPHEQQPQLSNRKNRRKNNTNGSLSTINEGSEDPISTTIPTPSTPISTSTTPLTPAPTTPTPIESAQSDPPVEHRPPSTSFSMITGSSKTIMPTLIIVSLTSLILLAIGGMLEFLAETTNPTLAALIEEEDAQTQLEEIKSTLMLCLRSSYATMQLWMKLLVLIILPTSRQSFAVAKGGWTVMQPSLKSALYWAVFETSELEKMIFASLCSIVIFLWLVEREIRRRQIVRRIYDSIQSVNKRRADAYGHVLSLIRRQNELAAALFPHILYIGASYTIWWVFEATVHGMSKGVVVWMIVVAYPVAVSVRALGRYRKYDQENPRRDRLLSYRKVSDESSLPAPEAEAVKRFSEMVSTGKDFLLSLWRKDPNQGERIVGRANSDVDFAVDVELEIKRNKDVAEHLEPCVHWLRYWSILSFISMFEQLPITGHILGLIEFWPDIRFFYALWLMFPGTNGADLSYRILVPNLNLVRQKLKLEPIRPVHESTGGEDSTIITFLRSSGMFETEFRRKILDACQTAGTLLFLVPPFMFAPGFVARIGTVIVGMIRPALATISSVIAFERTTIEMRNCISDESFKSERPDKPIPHIGKESIMWIEYWIVYTIFALAHGSASTVFGWWFPFWDHIHLFILVGFQLPYTRWAHYISVFPVLLLDAYLWSPLSALLGRKNKETIPQQTLGAIEEEEEVAAEEKQEQQEQEQQPTPPPASTTARNGHFQSNRNGRGRAPPPSPIVQTVDY